MRALYFLHNKMKGESKMNKPNVANIVKSAKEVITVHSPEILTGIGIAGMITTSVLAVKATPKALGLIEAKKHEEHLDDLTPAEVVKTTWKCYIPAAVTGAASIACLVGASSVHVRRNAALATAYKLSETALTEYREKVVETLGEKKEKAVREKVNEERLTKNPVSENTIIITEKGSTVCYDAISGRYFKSDKDKIQRAVNELNRGMMTDIVGYVSLNEFYDELGLDHIAVGDDLGWNIDIGLIDIDFGSHLMGDGTPCLVMDYCVVPRYNYSKII